MQRPRTEWQWLGAAAWVVVLGCGLGGCGADAEDAGCADDCRSESCPGPGASDECELEESCSRELGCAVADFRRSDSGPDIILNNPDAATCIFTALRDEVPGAYEWYITNETFPGQFSTRRRVVVLDGGQGILVTAENADLSSSREYLGAVPLAGASHFEGCLAETAPDAIYACLEDGYASSCGG